MLGLSTSYHAAFDRKVYDSVERIRSLGFECAELGAAHRFEENIWGEIKRIKKDFKDMRFTVHGLFPPVREQFWFNACEGLTKRNMTVMDGMIKAAEIVEADVVGIHPGYAAVLGHAGKSWCHPITLGVMDTEKSIENSREMVEFALMGCEELGIKLAVENAGMSAGSAFHNGMFLLPENIAKLLEPYPELGFLLDLGHALYMENLAGMLKFHERVCEMHLHFSPPRTAASTDRHMPVPETFDLGVLKRIKQLPKIPLVFEHMSNVQESEILREKKLVERFLAGI